MHSLQLNVRRDKKKSNHVSDLLGFDFVFFLKTENEMYFSAVVCSRHAFSSLFSAK